MIVVSIVRTIRFGPHSGPYDWAVDIVVSGKLLSLVTAKDIRAAHNHRHAGIDPAMAG
jgi:hypothetical protein